MPTNTSASDTPALAVAANPETSRPYHDFVSFMRDAAVKGRSIFFDRCHGNNGDDLIIAGAESVFAATQVRRENDPSAADILVINGGGMFVEGFKQGISKVKTYSEKFPGKVLCIGPQSFHLTSPALREIIASRTAPIVICVRESQSQKNLDRLLAGLEGVEFLTDHDLAFQIPVDHPVLAAPKSENHILIVERLDGEHHSRATPAPVAVTPAWYRRLAAYVLPQSLQRRLRKKRQEAKSGRATPYRKWVENKIEREFKHHQNLPRLVRDISSRDVATFDEFVGAIASSALVFTDRLHVGILATRMGKRTFLFEGSYHKCRGIYERSLTGFSNVTLVPPSVLLESAPTTARSGSARTPDARGANDNG